jgi:glycosidase
MRRSLLAAAALAAGCPSDPDDTATDTAPAFVRDCDVVVSRARGDATTIEVAGTFNDWAPQPLADDDGDGILTRSFGELRPGVYAYKFVVDGTWEDPPVGTFTAFDGDVENRALIVPDCDVPGLELLDARSDGPDALLASFRFTSAADAAPIDPDGVVVTLGGRDPSDLPGGAQVSVDVDVVAGRIDVAAAGLPDGKWTVRVEAADTSGRSADRRGFAPIWLGRFDVEDPFNRGLLYFVFTDRFRDGGGSFTEISGTEDPGINYLGGDLVGARQALEDGWFDELGVASIWLSPVPDNPNAAYPGSGGWHYTGYHGYWPIRGRAVDEHWGGDGVSGEQALREFVDAAHARGIRVLLDVPLNHVHEDHEWVSQHPEWFTAAPCPCTTDAGACNWDTNPLFCWFTDYLPDLNYRNPDIVTASIEDTHWWIEEFDVDGLRVDAAKHMDHVILRSLALSLNERYGAAEDGDLYLVGETFTGPGAQGLIMQFVAPYELDGQFDFPLLNPIRDAIGRTQGFRGLAAEVARSEDAYGDAVHDMSVFMGNHDVGRYATEIAGCPSWSLFGGCHDVLAASGAISGPQWDVINRLSMSFLFVATQPGPPLLYYGDEVGLAGAGDPDNRRLMPWTRTAAQDELLARFREIGRARAEIGALQTGERVELWVDDTLYVYARATDAGEVAIVAMNLGATRTQTVDLYGAARLSDGTLTNVLGSARTATVASDRLTLTLDPWEYAVFVP